MTEEELPAVQKLIEEALAPHEVEVDFEWGYGGACDYLNVQASIPFEELRNVFVKKWEPLIEPLGEKFGVFFVKFESLCYHGCGRFGRVNDWFEDWNKYQRRKNKHMLSRICVCSQCLREICDQEKKESGEDHIACFRCGKKFKENTGWNAYGFMRIGKIEESKDKVHLEMTKQKKDDYSPDEMCSEECAVDELREFLKKMKRNRYLKGKVGDMIVGK